MTDPWPPVLHEKQECILSDVPGATETTKTKIVYSSSKRLIRDNIVKPKRQRNLTTVLSRRLSPLETFL